MACNHSRLSTEAPGVHTYGMRLVRGGGVEQDLRHVAVRPLSAHTRLQQPARLVVLQLIITEPALPFHVLPPQPARTGQYVELSRGWTCGHATASPGSSPR
jgi:hypothetical protein